VSGARVPSRGTVLVTGAAGFIGSALCHRLRSLNYAVVGYDNLSRGSRRFLPDGVRLVEGDIRDGEAIARAISETVPDWVVHLAAMHFIPDCIARPAETVAVNVDGTSRVLEACRGSSVRNVIFASSAAVYTPTDSLCVEDETPIGPLEVYGESKVAAERLIEAFHAETGVATSTLRLFNAIGRNETNPHVVPHIFESLQAGDAIPLGNVAPRRDYIDTRDVAGAIVAAGESAQGARVLNVGTGAAYSVEDIVARLREILGREIRIVQEPSRMRATERMVLAADIARITRVTGWTPRISFEDTLKDLVAEYGLQTQPTSTK
jgi:UDP-glucose 4-epimerase